MALDTSRGWAASSPRFVRAGAAAGGVRLAASVAWTLAASVAYAACQWLTIVVLARVGSTRVLGQYAIGIAISSPVVLFASLQLRSVQASDTREQFTFGDYLVLRLVGLAVAAAAIVALALLGAEDRQGFLVIILVGLGRCVDAIGDVYYGLLQGRERMDRIARSQMMRSLLAVAALTLVLRLAGDLVPALAAVALSSAAVLLLYDRRSPSVLGLEPPARTWLHTSRAALLRLLEMSAPLGAVLMLVSLQANVPRYFVQRHLGTEPLGVFAALFSIGAAGQLFVSAVGQSITPRLARAFASGDRRWFLRAVIRMGAGAAAAGAAGVALAGIAGRPLLRLFFGAPYAAHERTFAILMGAAGVSYVASVLGYAMTASRNFRVQLPLFVATVAAGALAATFLVPAWGLDGAAAAYGVSMATQCAGSAWIVAIALRRRGEEAP